MNLLNIDTIRTLIQHHDGPCVSLYQPTHRFYPDNQQDPIRFKNLVTRVEESLRSKFSARDLGPILEPLRQLQGNTSFWNHTLDGLAVLATMNSFRVFRLQRPVKELAVVADSFHVKPLLRIVQSADRFQVLSLTRESAAMYQGNRDSLDVIETRDDFPSKLTIALGDELTEPYQAVGSYGSGIGGPAMHHGHGSRKDEIDKDTDRYFRAVDRAVTAQYSKPSGLPLVLVALAEHQPVFRQISQNAALVATGVSIGPKELSTDELRAAAWKVMEPMYLARLAEFSESFRTAQARQKGSADLSDAARAAVAGRIGMLLVDADKVLPGRLDPATGAITSSQLHDPDTDDLIDDLAELVLRNGGDVIVVPAARMPSSTGIAAVYRY